MDDVEYYETPRDFPSSANESVSSQVWANPIRKCEALETKPSHDKDRTRLSGSDISIKLKDVLSTSLTDTFDFEYRMLQEQYRAKCIALEEIQKQKMILKNENQSLICQLANEKKKAVHINQKIKYIQENQNLLLRLKEEYKNLKLNQEKKIPTLENSSQCDLLPSVDREIQTTSSTSLSKEIQANITIIPKNDILSIKESDINAIQDTVKLLKQKMLTVHLGKENNIAQNYQIQVEALKTETENLKQALANKDETNQKITNEMDKKLSLLEKVLKEKTVLKKVILKLEKRQREIVKKYKLEQNESGSIISDREKKIVRQIVQRYIAAKSMKSNTISKTSVQLSISNHSIKNSSSVELSLTESAIIKS